MNFIWNISECVLIFVSPTANIISGYDIIVQDLVKQRYEYQSANMNQFDVSNNAPTLRVSRDESRIKFVADKESFAIANLPRTFEDSNTSFRLKGQVVVEKNYKNAISANSGYDRTAGDRGRNKRLTSLTVFFLR